MVDAELQELGMKPGESLASHMSMSMSKNAGSRDGSNNKNSDESDPQRSYPW